MGSLHIFYICQNDFKDFIFNTNYKWLTLKVLTGLQLPIHVCKFGADSLNLKLSKYFDSIMAKGSILKIFSCWNNSFFLAFDFFCS